MENYVEMSLREVQLAELDILKKFDTICKKLNLKYFLYYGTLIGAIRHHGYIPWDDDIDVIMPRSSYEKLLNYAKENESDLVPYVLCHYSTDPNYVYPIMRFCNTEYIVKYHEIDGFGKGLFIDIYPFDGCGNDISSAKKYLKRATYRSMIISLAGVKKINKSEKGLAATIIKKLLYYFSHFVGANRLIRLYDKKCKKLKYENNKYVAGALWPYYGVKDLAKKEDLDEMILVDFEGYQFPAPKQYDIHLRRLYGDYMKYPSPDKRIAHHFYTAYKKVY